MTKSVFRGNIAALILLLNMVFYDLYAGPILALLPKIPLVLSIASDFLVFIPPAVVYFLISNKGKGFLCDTFYIKEMDVINILLIVVISIFIQPFLMSVSAVTSLFFPNAASEYLESMADLPAFSTLIITSLLPAFFEELFFRGIVFSNFRKLSPVKACVLCGLLFGMAHLNFQQFSYAFLMGCVFCYFVYKTGSIFSSILSHFLINGSQTILSALSIKMTAAANPQALEAAQSTQATIHDLIPFFYLTLLSLIPLAFAFYFFNLHNSKNNGFESESNENAVYSLKQNIINWPLVLIIIIFLYYSFSA